MATTARVSPWLTAFEESQRMAVEADPGFRAAESLAGGREALRCARTIALLSYRCDQGYNLRQRESDPDVIFPERACSYHQYQGEKFVRRFDAYSYWYLSHAVDSINVGRGRGGVAEALGRIRADSLVAAIDTDLIFPPRDMAPLAEAIPHARFALIRSLFGHDGFLLETGQITALLQPILESL
jgi:homoserine O-acetyltransferase